MKRYIDCKKLDLTDGYSFQHTFSRELGFDRVPLFDTVANKDIVFYNYTHNKLLDSWMEHLQYLGFKFEIVHGEIKTETTKDKVEILLETISELPESDFNRLIKGLFDLL